MRVKTNTNNAMVAGLHNKTGIAGDTDKVDFAGEPLFKVIFDEPANIGGGSTMNSCLLPRECFRKY